MLNFMLGLLGLCIFVFWIVFGLLVLKKFNRAIRELSLIQHTLNKAQWRETHTEEAEAGQ